MKPEKLVTMHCPSCGADFDKQPIIIINRSNGSSHMEEHLPKKCKYCKTGLVRSVTKTKTTFKFGKLNAEDRQNVGIPA
ncbi:MAG: hypothetical protein WCD81_07945 [Candidatus Bathyarchaeia archaeon]